MSADFYPLTAPGMPFPGPSFLRWASSLGEESAEGKGKNLKIVKDRTLSTLYRSALYSAGKVTVPVLTHGGHKSSKMTVVTGHQWGAKHATGPVKSDVMIIGKMLNEDEISRRRMLVGGSGALLLDSLRRLGAKDEELKTWYVTALLKCQHPDNGRKWSVDWEKDFLPLLHQELRIVQPKYILFLGTDSTKALLGKAFNVKNMEGRVVDFKIPLDQDAPTSAAGLTYHNIQAMTCVHPAAVLRTPEMQGGLDYSLTQFLELVRGKSTTDWDKNLDCRTITGAAQLEDLVAEIQHDPETYVKGTDGVKRAWIALDAEWQGEHPQNRGSYLRTIQVSWGHDKAACVVLRAPGGELAFDGGVEAAIDSLRTLLTSTKERPVRLIGHFLVADMEWLLAEGLDLRKEFLVPNTWEAAIDAGGYDTGLAEHALNETGDFSLKSTVLRYRLLPRYDLELQDWLKKHQVGKAKVGVQEDEELDETGEAGVDMEGFGDCPDAILIPYANLDAIGTRRLAVAQWQKLFSDEFGNCCWEPFWLSMRAARGVLEMHVNGLRIDRSRIDNLTKIYMKVSAKLQKDICDWARWPDFNVRSVLQVRELLFGEHLNGKERTPPNFKAIRLRPEGARALLLKPILSSGKKPQPWDEAIRDTEEGDVSPSTNKMSLAILAEENQGMRTISDGSEVDVGIPIRLVRDYRFIDQTLKSLLRPPVRVVKDKKLTDELLERNGNWVYTGGLPAHICDDQRVRTHLYQTKETGRWSSARPPLQNIPKRRESDHKRILGSDYVYPLRSIICATPGRVLIEADLKGAELLGMAIMSGDENMVDHCLRNQIDESDPNFYDIHSSIAVLSFRLDCEPTKKGLSSLGMEHLRIVAKSVIFGLAYGRGAKAIALAAKEEGVVISTEDAQKIIDTVFEMYPKLLPYFNECRARAIRDRWLCGPFGRFRRFPTSPEIEKYSKYLRDVAAGRVSEDERPPKLNPSARQAIGEIERQAMNFPIQGMIADAMSIAIDNLLVHRDACHPDECDYDLTLQIHDAVLLECDPCHVPAAFEALHKCLSVEIFPTDLSGMPTHAKSYKLGADIEMFLQWGVAPCPDELYALGIDPIKYGHWKPAEKFQVGPDQTVSGLVHGSYKKKIWTPEGFLSAYAKN